MPSNKQAHAPTAETDVSVAFKALNNAMLCDRDYAWSWHCNLAMPVYDELHAAGIDHEKAHVIANSAAERLTGHLFGFTMKSPNEMTTTHGPHHIESKGVNSHDALMESRRMFENLVNSGRITLNDEQLKILNRAALAAAKETTP